jgi:hypothetical protein
MALQVMEADAATRAVAIARQNWEVMGGNDHCSDDHPNTDGLVYGGRGHVAGSGQSYGL